jgi:hypothetical protein
MDAAGVKGKFSSITFPFAEQVPRISFLQCRRAFRFRHPAPPGVAEA